MNDGSLSLKDLLEKKLWEMTLEEYLERVSWTHHVAAGFEVPMDRVIWDIMWRYVARTSGKFLITREIE